LMMLIQNYVRSLDRREKRSLCSWASTETVYSPVRTWPITCRLET